MLSGKTFFITGSTGRLGCATVRRLEELGANVAPLVLAGYPSVPKRVKWIANTKPIKINNSRDLTNLPTPDYVINFHWQINRELSYIKQLIYEIDNNINRIAYLWDWLSDKDCQRFVNISSVKIFSHLNRNPITSVTEPRPLSPYGIAKIAAERFFDAYFQKAGFDVIHLRLCAVMSLGEHPSHLISNLHNSAFKNQHIKVNTGHLVYLIYIDEVVDLIINATINAKQQRFLLTTSGTKVDHVVEKFEQISDRTISAKYVDLEPGSEDPIFVSDIDKLRADWIRSTSLDDAIANIIRLNR